MNIDDLVAIDVHTHAEVSCWNPFDNYGEEYDRAADKHFRSNRRPTIEETIAYYRERKTGLVMFTVDSESNLGRRRIPNEEIDLSGWSPKYFPPQFVQYANTLLRDRILFGSDFPLITPERWMKDFDEAGFREEVKPLILKENAARMLKLRIS